MTELVVPARALLLSQETTMIMPLTVASLRIDGRSKPRQAVQETLAVLSKVLAYPIRFYQARRDIAQLAAMDDVQLRDIGLTRFDVANAAALPLDRNPTEALSNVVAERRRNTRSH
jgi:uncharacterized protein YjiS (DUF1127 family)